MTYERGAELKQENYEYSADCSFFPQEVKIFTISHDFEINFNTTQRIIPLQSSLNGKAAQ